jgi:hypothetical protein
MPQLNFTWNWEPYAFHAVITIVKFDGAGYVFGQ